MKKLIALISVKISQKPLTSILITFVISIILTSTAMFFGKGLMISDGIYAVKSTRIIELKGDAELPLYHEVMANLKSIPNDVTAISIGSGFGKYLDNTKMCDLVYRLNEFNGDYYETLVVLKKGDWIESKYYGKSIKENPSKNFNLNDRTTMVKNSVQIINELNDWK